MKRLLFPVIVFCLCAGSVYAQTTLTGDWKAELTPEGMGTFDFPVSMHQSSDSLSMWMLLEEGRVDIPGVALKEDRLEFVIPLHGDGIQCSVARRSDDLFAGVCSGPMGESVTLLRRIETTGVDE